MYMYYTTEQQTIIFLLNELNASDYIDKTGNEMIK